MKGSLKHNRRRAGALALVAAAALALGGVAPAAEQGEQAAQGHGPAYKDPRKPVEVRVRDLLGRMTLEEKVGQMGQINAWVLLGDPGSPWDWPADFNPTIVDDVFGKDKIGSVLSGGGAWPPPPRFANDGRGWAQFTNEIQRLAMDPARNRLGIPIIYGVDAVHGHNNLSNATNFPHQIGLGATFNPGLVAQLGHTTSTAVRATGAHWNFAPVLDVQRDTRWGRSYEPYGEDAFLIARLGEAFVRGSQGWSLSRGDSVAATAKHFTGYGAPDSGRDRTDATISEAELQDLHVPPFEAAIDAGAATAMINSGSVNGEPVHASRRLITDVLRRQLGFHGVVITDWNDIEALWHKYGVANSMEDAVALAFNAGIDMSMIPLAPDNKYDGRPDHGFFEAMLGAVAHGKLSERRIDESVSRILALKFRLGLFERPFADADRANAVIEDPAQKPLARRAAQESLVLLENEGVLPLSRHGGRKILVTGPQSDSATHQLGGWTVGWQGAFNLNNGITVPPATTVRRGIEQAAGAGQVIWKQGAPVGDTTDRDGVGSHPEINDPNHPAVAAARAEAVAAAAGADVIVAAVGESPYAEGQGDDETPALSPAQARLVDELVATGKPVVVVVIAGRPLAMSPQLDGAKAALMAFLPGSEGGAAIADALFGNYNPSGRLTVSWPKSVGDVPIAYNEPGRPYSPRYAFGHGLSYSRFAVTDLDAPRHVGRHGRVRVEADVRNWSSRSGDYTALAIVERVSGSPSTAAPRQLVAFDREHLHGWDKDEVSLSFDIDQLAVTSAGGKSVPRGEYRLIVGDRSQTFRVW